MRHTGNLNIWLQPFSQWGVSNLHFTTFFYWDCGDRMLTSCPLRLFYALKHFVRCPWWPFTYLSFAVTCCFSNHQKAQVCKAVTPSATFQLHASNGPECCWCSLAESNECFDISQKKKLTVIVLIIILANNRLPFAVQFCAIIVDIKVRQYCTPPQTITTVIMWN